METFSAKMYHVLKSAQGDFNQGNVPLFGDTTGKKCACNALFSLCWLSVCEAGGSGREELNRYPPPSRAVP